MCDLDPPAGFTSGMPSVVYVSETGTGRGYTPEDPMSIARAASGARAGSTVKLLDGTYTIHEFPQSNLTVEAASGHNPQAADLVTVTGAGSTVRFPDPPLDQSDGFDPLVNISWTGAWFAEDPDWDHDTASWGDGSGWGRHATQATENNRPGYTVSHANLNNRPAVTFNGSQWVTVPEFDLTDSYSIVLIGYVPSLNAAHHPCGFSANNRVRLNATGGAYQFTGGASSISGGTTTAGDLFIVAVCNGSSSLLRVGSTTVATGTTTATSAGALNIGSSSSSAGQFAGAVAFLGLYHGDITEHHLFDTLRSWAAEHYGMDT